MVSRPGGLLQPRVQRMRLAAFEVGHVERRSGDDYRWAPVTSQLGM